MQNLGKLKFEVGPDRSVNAICFSVKNMKCFIILFPRNYYVMNVSANKTLRSGDFENIKNDF